MSMEFTDRMCELVRSLGKRGADLEVFVSVALRDNGIELDYAVHLARRVRGIERDAAALAHLVEREVRAAGLLREETGKCSPG